NPWIRLVAREVLLVGATAPYLPPHFVRRQEPSPFRLRLRGTKPGLRRAPAAVPSPTSWGTHPGDFVPQPKVGGRGPHCWGSGVGGSVEPVDQAGRAGGLVGG